MSIQPIENRCNVIELDFKSKRNINNNTSNTSNRGSKKVKQRKEKREPVQPIKLQEDLKIAKEYLFNRKVRGNPYAYRDYTLFCLGITVYKRISDLLALTVGDILNEDMTFKNDIHIITKKRQKDEEIILTFSPKIKEILREYFQHNPEIVSDMNNALFPTRQSNMKSMCYKTAYNIIKDVEEEINKYKQSDNDKVHLATHSMRKTPAYHFVQKHKDDQYSIAKTSKVLGHTKIDTTLHYLGLDKKELEECYTFSDSLL